MSADKLTDLQAQLTVAQKELAEEKARNQEIVNACKTAKDLLNSVVDPKFSSVLTPGEQWENVWQPGASLVLLVSGLLALYCDSFHCLAFPTALAINGFLLLLLIAMSIRKSVSRPFLIEFAHRFYFIFIFFFLLVGLVSSFGRLYVDSENVFRTGSDPPTNSQMLKDPTEAAYFSAVTLMTVGYGDFAPRERAELLVIWELGSGAMLLLIVLPVLASRLALLGEGH
jgi:hypothetical protein